MPRSLAAFAVLLLVACRGSAGPAAPGKQVSCRDVAVRAERLIAAQPADKVESATRFLASVIDLCQKPGLSPSALACLSGAADLAEAESCPSVPTVTDAPSPPTCRDAVEHALVVLDADPDLRPADPSDRDDMRRDYTEQCRSLSVAGVRCVRDAATTDAVNECLEDPALHRPRTEPDVELEDD